MTNITIPPEALEAAAIELYRSIWGHDCYSWAEIDSETRDSFRQHARAACLAMLRSWPGMIQGPEGIFLGRILPLNTEKPND
jgi:hypothetical protein